MKPITLQAADLLPDDDVFVVEMGDEECETGLELGGLSYLEPMPSSIGGGLDFDKIGAILGKGEKARWVSVGDEIRKSTGCNKTAIKFERVHDKAILYNFIKCWRWICSKCGAKGGRIHMKRVSRIIERLVRVYKESLTEGYEGNTIDISKGVLDLRQLVFTMPMEIREYFMARKDIKAFNRMCERIVRKEFPDKYTIRYFHAFGDKDKGLFAPHVNFHMFEFQKTGLKLPMSKINSIKSRYVSALQAYLLQVHGVTIKNEVWEKIDIHYSFVEGDKTYQRKKFNPETGNYEMTDVEGMKVLLHRIEYMARPCPGYANFDKIKKNEYLLRLFVVEMKGFIYITNCGKWKIKDINRKEEKKELESIAGGKLTLCLDNEKRIIYVTRSQFDTMYEARDYKELSDGFYEIIEKPRIKKGKKK